METGELTTRNNFQQQVCLYLLICSIFKYCSGTTFHYEKKYKNSKARGPLTLFAPESIRALGPTTEPLFIVVSMLYQKLCRIFCC